MFDVMFCPLAVGRLSHCERVPLEYEQLPTGYGSKSHHQGTAGFSPWFHLPGLHVGYHFLTHSRSSLGSREVKAKAPDALMEDQLEGMAFGTRPAPMFVQHHVMELVGIFSNFFNHQQWYSTAQVNEGPQNVVFSLFGSQPQGGS